MPRRERDVASSTQSISAPAMVKERACFKLTAMRSSWWLSRWTIVNVSSVSNN